MADLTQNLDHHINFAARAMGEITSFTVVLGGVMAILPSLGVLLGIIWYALNIYDWIIQKRRAARKLPHPPSPLKDID